MTPSPALPSLQQIIKQYGLSAKKNLGQHFLLDGYVTDQIVTLCGDLSCLHVIEIGPGPGGLTRSLLSSNAAHVAAIEKDERCLPIMEMLKQAAPDRFICHHADALEISLEDIGASPRCVIANLPYNIGTELVVGWLKQLHTYGPEYLQHITVMLQKEVAERITALPGTKAYGRLSVMAQWLCECHVILEVPPEAFTPPPKVESAVVQLIPRVGWEEISLERLETLLRIAFQFRRKKITAALKQCVPEPETIVNTVGIDPSLRPDQLSVEMYLAIAKALAE